MRAKTEGVMQRVEEVAKERRQQEGERAKEARRHRCSTVRRAEHMKTDAKTQGSHKVEQCYTTGR